MTQYGGENNVYLSSEAYVFVKEMPLESLYKAISRYKEFWGREGIRYIFLSPKSLAVINDALDPYLMTCYHNQDTHVAMFCGLYIIVLPDIPDTTVMIGGLRR